jgi:hypothetical protein
MKFFCCILLQNFKFCNYLFVAFVLSRVYGYMTNNNGSCIQWSDLLTAYFTISLNHNQLQQITINNWLAPFSFSLYSNFWFTIYSRTIRRRDIHCPPMDICEPHRKHCFLYCCIYSMLHRNGSYPIVACMFVVAYFCRLYLTTGCLPRICLHGNMFTESLSSNGFTCHGMK